MVFIKNSPHPVSLEKTNLIIQQMNNCICLVKSNFLGEKSGTGFFCNIPYKGKELKVLITANHIIDAKILKKNKLVHIELNGILKEIIINDNRKIYSNKQYNITIIEINPYIDQINDFLSLDENILYKEKSENISIENGIYLLQYFKNGNLKVKEVSYGILKSSIKYYPNFDHLCSTRESSGGAPLLNLRNNKVIGIHLGYKINIKLNFGIYLKYSINDFQNDNNLIKIYEEYNEKDFSNLKLISLGSYGDIYSAYSIKDETEICLKRINIEKMKLNYQLNELKDFQNDLNNEINILKSLSYNENSVKYYGNYDNKKDKIIIMEKCDKNSNEFVRQRGSALTVEEIKRKFKDLNILFKIM